MIGLRGSIALLAIACLAAGAGGGVLAARSLAPREVPVREGTFADYEARLAQTFELSAERRDALHAVLASYESDLARIKDRHMADYLSSIEPELRERGRFYRELVRDRVLPEAHRAEFERMALGPAGPMNP
jgi:hypothetical protein